MLRTTCHTNGIDDVTAEYYASPGEAAQRVQDLRSQGIHAWREVNGTPTCGADLFRLSTVACFRLPHVE